MIVDLFAGLGGWDLAARELGYDALGVEHDKWACATRRVAGLQTLEVDVEKLDPALFYPCEALFASPPCQGFSTAGKRDPNDPRNRFVWEMQRWITALRPNVIAFEQVPPVLPIWEAYAKWLALLGYSCWTGVLHAEQYGVPQTRKRAILIASRDVHVGPPQPTHSKFYPRDPGRLDENVSPWTSMAEALEWGYDRRPSPVVTGGGVATGGPEPFGNGSRKALADWMIRTRGDRKTSGGNLFSPLTPERALTEKVCSWTQERPAPTLVTSRRSDEGIIVGRQLPEGEERDPSHGGWSLLRPATTIVSTFSPDVVAGPGYRKAGGDSRQNAPGGIRITLEEALILQGFPPDYPVQGVKSHQFLQVGNAIPPPLAKAILSAVLDKGP